MYPDRPGKVTDNKKTKNMVRGRYLATFSSNPFAISEKLVAALVAAGVLVATFGLTSYWQLAIGRPEDQPLPPAATLLQPA